MCPGNYKFRHKNNKEDEVVNVCQAIQEMREESERAGERQGRLMQAQETAKNLYEMGLDTEKIAQVVGYALETVKDWIKEAKSQGKFYDQT